MSDERLQSTGAQIRECPSCAGQGVVGVSRDSFGNWDTVECECQAHTDEPPTGFRCDDPERAYIEMVREEARG